MFISEGVKDLAKQMIENPNDWHQTTYHFENRTHPDIRIWTANGWSFIELSGNACFNFIEKIYLNKAIKQSIANKLLITPKA